MLNIPVRADEHRALLRATSSARCSAYSSRAATSSRRVAVRCAARPDALEPLRWRPRRRARGWCPLLTRHGATADGQAAVLAGT
eukprot:8118145-Pyramimonas_sp.AAC.1